MLIGLCGAQGAGKSTLAAEFVKTNPSFAFAATSVSSIMKEHGMDPMLDYPIAERMTMQNVILDELDKFYRQFKEKTLFDRTPLDCAAYMLADVQRTNVDPELHPAIEAYVAKAIKITNNRFGMLLFVPAVLQHERRVEPREGKAPSTGAYVEHVGQLIQGLKTDERVKVKTYSLPRAYLEMELRVKALGNAAGKTIEGQVEHTLLMKHMGVALH